MSVKWFGGHLLNHQGRRSRSSFKNCGPRLALLFFDRRSFSDLVVRLLTDVFRVCEIRGLFFFVDRNSEEIISIASAVRYCIGKVSRERGIFAVQGS